MRPAVCLFLCAFSTAHAAGGSPPDWSFCAADFLPPQPELPIGERAFRLEQPVEIEANSADTRDEAARLAGDVRLRRADQTLRSDNLLFNRNTQSVRAEGNIEYYEPGLRIFAPLAELELASDSGRLENVRYRIEQHHARGDATSVELDGPTRTLIHRVTYTTCDPGDDAWRLRASRILLDREEGFGTAWHSRLEVMGVPVFYLPWISFPIDDRRKTGFLMPSLSHSDLVGTEIRAPYYLNLAPNYDATLTPRYLSQRGTQVLGEFRYLLDGHDGTLNLEYLEADRATGTNRSLMTYRHDGAFSDNWRVSAVAGRVSDAQYFHDLGNELELASITHLERRADLLWQRPWASVTLRAQEFQTVDATLTPIDYPYQRAPQLTLWARPAPLPYLYGELQAELVEFDHPVLADARRSDATLALGLPLRASWGHLEPRVAQRETRYEQADGSAGPQRSLPAYSVDAGLTFERELDDGWVQTLEPRTRYLKIPYEDQSALPVYDTARFDFGYDQLFRDNRYSGPDRVGDTHQASVALATRLLDETGEERLTAEVGQILYLWDRRVTLPAETVDRTPHSLVASRLTFRPGGGWALRAENLWDPERDNSAQGSVRARWTRSARQILDFGYRYERDVVDQTDVGLRWAITPAFRTLARWNYALDAGRSIDTLAGIEYESCCWAVRLATRQYVVNDDASGEINHSVLVEIELKGLTSVGSKIYQVLDHGMLGALP